ncbi:MAG: PHB depolymerase family esterase [Bacteroidia bacterium]|nr:PHB depolymerase family esterase [Bacteroidia bacterium]
MKIIYLSLLFLLLAYTTQAQPTGWQTVTNFGTNPGALNMYSYAPSALPANAPLVVVMHGCTQTATQVATQTGWNTMANRHGFYTVYPEQISANNSSLCFNWFEPGDQAKNQGEALSIKQIIDYMRVHYSIDSTRIFVTGLSAGACMGNVMMACYPQLINAGAVMSGVAYKAATSAFTANAALNGYVSNTPAQWGNYVRNENPTYTGAYPKVAVFQGTGDFVVNYNNATEIVKQWTNVHSTDQTADDTVTSFAGNPYVTQKKYTNANNKSVVETYIISTFTHAIALDTGACFMQCGATGNYAYDINFNSTYWAAYFFDILNYGNTITGLTSVTTNQTNVTYSITVHLGSTYLWQTAPTASIMNGQNTNSNVTVDFGTQSGYIQVTETDANGCKIGPIKIWVNVGVTPTAIAQNDTPQATMYYDNYKQSVSVTNLDYNRNNQLLIATIDGRIIMQQRITNNEIYLSNNLTAGVYIMQLQQEDKISTQKITIIK